jgi:hypothetical protein
MENSQFNLTNQLVQEQKSIWRIEQHYIPQSNTQEQSALWMELLDQKKAIVVKIKELTA